MTSIESGVKKHWIMCSILNAMHTFHTEESEKNVRDFKL